MRVLNVFGAAILLVFATVGLVEAEPPAQAVAQICAAAPGSVACAAAQACALDASASDCRDGLRAQAFESAQWAIQNEATTALAAVGVRFGAQSNVLGRAIRAREDAAQRVREIDATMVAALGASDYDSYAARRAEAEVAQADLVRRDSELALTDPDYQELMRPRPISIVEVQRLLRPEEVLLVYMVGARSTFAWAVTREESTWARIDAGEAALARKVAQLRSDLDPTRGCLRSPVVEGPEPAPETASFNFGLANNLYRTLVEPFEAIVSKKSRVLVVPSGPIMSLPVGVLVASPPPTGPTDLAAFKGAKWFGLQKALVTLPAPSSLRALRCPRMIDGACVVGAGRPSNRRPLVAYGDPALNPNPVSDDVCRGLPYSAGLVDQAMLETLPPLPGTRRELMAIRDALRASDNALRLGARATERRVRSEDLEDVRVLVFATHGILATGLSGAQEAGLVLTPPGRQSPKRVAGPDDDGYLTVSEAAALHLGADWVVLSACNTALAGRAGGDGLSGLTRAFLYAGAETLLVSHWPVNDAAAPTLTSLTIRASVNGALGRAEALQGAMSDMLRTAASVRTAHPSYWAPFALVGEGA